MAASEDEGAGPIEGVRHRQGVGTEHLCEEGQSDQQEQEEGERDAAGPARDRNDALAAAARSSLLTLDESMQPV